MSDELEGGTAVATPKKKTAKKKVAAKASAKVKGKSAKKGAKKADKKVAKAKTANPGAFGADRDHDVPWNDKKVAIFKALKSLKAVGDNVKTAKEIAERAGVTTENVRHYCYHAKAAKLVNVVDVEGVHGYCFSLTANGSKIDPVAELKKQKAAKAKG